MKIINASNMQLSEVRQSPSIPSPGSAQDMADLKKEFQAWKIQVLAEFRQMDSVRTNQSAMAIAKLTDEIQALRKMILELPRPEPQSPSPAEPPVPPPTKPNPVLDAAAGLSPQKPERKVAFLGQLWDYLNQAETEIPLRKTDRIE